MFLAPSRLEESKRRVDRRILWWYNIDTKRKGNIK